jgi:peptidoglycan pentaglycine glycine transferase (the first glycine)
MSRCYTLHILAEPERARWEHFVAEQSAGNLLQSWGWGELKASVGWRPVRLALCEGERIVAGAQVLQRSAPRVPARLAHLAYIPRGPLLDWSQPALVETFLGHLHGFLRKQGALALRLEPPVVSLGEQVARHLQALHFHSVHPVQPLRTIVLDLTPDESSLLAGMKPKWRYNIRLAERKGVTVRRATSAEDVRAWYRLYEVTSERDRFGIHTLDYYLRVWELFASRGQLSLLLAEYQGELLAGIFVGLSSQLAIYLYGASGNEQRQLMPNYALQWEAIRWAREQGARQYDFWGIPDTDAEDEAMAGVYRFKAGWGGELVKFAGGYEFDYHPLAMRLARRWLPSGG